ncbi:MAG: hypothetical protein LUD72_09770 [Bacteroidales bacterium]|nr:hypothetical protein [Bacteroidales bacterium]
MKPAPNIEATKDYANPIAECEQGIVAHLLKSPRIAGQKIKVFGNTQEGAQELFNSTLAQGLGQCVVVSIASLSNVSHAQTSITENNPWHVGAKAKIVVSVTSPTIFGTAKPSATSDIGFSILRELDGTLFSRPFLTALQLEGWTQSEVSSKNFSSVLEFSAWIGLYESTPEL